MTKIIFESHFQTLLKPLKSVINPLIVWYQSIFLITLQRMLFIVKARALSSNIREYPGSQLFQTMSSFDNDTGFRISVSSVFITIYRIGCQPVDST